MLSLWLLLHADYFYQVQDHKLWMEQVYKKFQLHIENALNYIHILCTTYQSLSLNYGVFMTTLRMERSCNFQARLGFYDYSRKVVVLVFTSPHIFVYVGGG